MLGVTSESYTTLALIKWKPQWIVENNKQGEISEIIIVWTEGNKQEEQGSHKESPSYSERFYAGYCIYPWSCLKGIF